MSKNQENSGQSKYCYEGTTVLKNKKNILDQTKLLEIEKGIVCYKVYFLYENDELSYPFKITLDVNHFINIHKYLFGDIYDFAGEIRDESIYKTNEPYYQGKTPFCYPEFIYTNLKNILENMKQNARCIKNESQLIQFLSYYYSEINIIHPFREGNGRTIREFLREYVKKLNSIIDFGYYDLDYSRLNEFDIKQFMKGTIYSAITGDLEMLKESFGKMLVNELDNKKTR